MEASSSTSHSLVRHVQRGDPRAWQRFSAIYVPLVYRWTTTAGLQPSDALDVVQNVFVSIVRHVGGFRQNEAGQSLRAWLRTITRNAIVDWRRSRGRLEPTLVGNDPHWDHLQSLPESGDEPPADERTLVIARAIQMIRAEFAPANWDMFWKMVLEGRSADQIAAEHGLSSWAVYKSKARVLARLRELVADFLE